MGKPRTVWLMPKGSRLDWKLGAAVWEGNLAVPHSLKLGLFDPKIPLLGISTVVQVKIHVQSFPLLRTRLHTTPTHR